MSDYHTNYQQEKDPWGNHRKKSGPPELDELVRKFFRKLKNGVNYKLSDPFEKSSSSLNLNRFYKNRGIFIGGLVLIILAIWLLSGIYIVGPAEQAVVLQFGRYVKTENPGIHWILQLVETRRIVNVQRISIYHYDSNLLTEDENIVHAALIVQYRIANLENYLFNVDHPEESLKQATASVLRQAIGNVTLEDILTRKQISMKGQLEEVLKRILSQYQTGLEVTDVTLQSVLPPEEVVGAFNDAVKAKEDGQRFINKANTYKETVLLSAERTAQHFLQKAEDYKQRSVLTAEAEVIPFLAWLSIYQKAPQVTATRLYFSTIQAILKKNRKILMDTKSGNTLFYLPFDCLSHSSKLRSFPKITSVSASSKTELPEKKERATRLNEDNLLLRHDRQLYQGREI